MKHSRPDWDSYFMEIARIVSKRSTCKRRNVGALIVKGKRILSTGYNGAPMGLRHCIETECLREKLNIASGERHELCRGLHAEQNAIIQAAYHGVSISGADIYSTHLPCSICIKMIINAGVARVFYADGYSDDLAMDMVNESGVKLVKVEIKRQVESGKSKVESKIRKAVPENRESEVRGRKLEGNKSAVGDSKYNSSKLKIQNFKLRTARKP